MLGYIFYLAVNGGFQSIHMIDRQSGSDEVVIQHLPLPGDYTQGVPFETTFDPTGERVLIQEVPADLYVLSLRDRQPRLVAQALSSEVIWSPDGTQIALTQLVDDKLRLDIFNAAGDPLTSVPLLPLQYSSPSLRYGYCR